MSRSQAARAARSQSASRRHWHHQVHLDWGRRWLYFALLQFSRHYPQDEVLNVLKEIAADNDVTSYASYEVLGEWDLLLRLYVEPFRQRRVSEDIERKMERFGFRDQKWLDVHEVVRHWVWAPGRREVGEPRAPARKDIERSWPRRELRSLNSLEQANGRRPEFVQRYVAADLVAFKRHHSGMKLAIAIQRRGPTPEDWTYQAMKLSLARVLDDSEKWMHERSLYAFGRHSETTFLIMCRIDEEAFARVRFDLLQPIGEVIRDMHARVATYPIVSDELLCFADRLPPAVVRPRHTNVAGLLQEAESHELEVKGSAFSPLDGWLYKGSVPLENNSFCVKTVCKEVVGFLNAGGGSIVVGALETRALGKTTEALEDCERIGEYVLCGIMDETFRARGWDLWERKLRDVLRSHIKPVPVNAIDIRRESFGETPLALVSIDPVEPDYFLQVNGEPDSYWARDGTSARKLSGEDLERHRKRMRAEIRRRRRSEQ